MKWPPAKPGRFNARFGSESGSGLTNTFDGFGRLETASSNMDGTRTLTYSYDADSNKTVVKGTAGTGYWAGYVYDGLDRVKTVQSGSTAYSVAQIAYNDQGLRQSLGLGLNAVKSSTAYQYDGIGRLSSLTYAFPFATANNLTLSFGSYNAASQILSRTSSNDLYASNRAISVNRGYVPNGLNQYGKVAGIDYQYDGNGNLTSDGDLASGQANAYSYDRENRLIESSGKKNVKLAYDPLGRLWKVIADPVSAPVTTYFVYDGDRRIEEDDPSLASPTNLTYRKSYYIFGPGADEPLVSYDFTANGAPRYLHADHQGSVIALADALGNPATNAYDAWGIPNSGNLGKFGYTGQAWLPELGMYYYKARIYSPMLGRFLQTDPIGYKDQMGLYAYVGNDSVNGRDPSGLYECQGKNCDKVDGYVNAAHRALLALDPKSDAAKKLGATLNYLGKSGQKNGVTIVTTSLAKGIQAQAGPGGRITVDTAHIEADAARPGYAAANPGAGAPGITEALGGGTIVHEARHELDTLRLGFPDTKLEVYRTELNAYRSEIGVYQGLNIATGLWNSSMSGSQMDSAVGQGAQASTDSWCERSRKC